MSEPTDYEQNHGPHCGDCGRCESCIDRSMDHAAEQDEAEMQMECPFCNGNGWNSCTFNGGGMTIECAECGGTGCEA